MLDCLNGTISPNTKTTKSHLNTLINVLYYIIKQHKNVRMLQYSTHVVQITPSPKLCNNGKYHLNKL